jgi:glutamate racemase
LPERVAAHLGIVDWGIGGIGLLGLLDHLVPGLPVTYWSDTGATPYGIQRTADLRARLRSVVAELVALGCTEVVLACNAASTVLAGPGIGRTAVPVEGIIGHGVAAVPPGSGFVGVVGGRRTILGGHHRRALEATGRTVRSRVAQPLSAHIEGGRIGSPAFEADLHRIVAPLRGADALVLACTHYPAASDRFAAELPGTTLVDPATHLAAAIAARHPTARDAAPASRTHLTTGDPTAMRRAAAAAWSTDLPAVGSVALP